MGDKFLKYNITTNTITKSQFVDIEQNCNAFTITNVGDTIATVDNQIYYPGTIGTNLGDSRSFGGNEREIYSGGQIKVQFNIPLGANPAIEIVQKYYQMRSDKIDFE